MTSVSGRGLDRVGPNDDRVEGLVDLVRRNAGGRGVARIASGLSAS